MSYNKQELLAKWGPLLDHEGAPAIKDDYKRFVTATLLENQERFLQTERQEFLSEASHANAAGALPDAGGVARYDPVLISLVRRAMPQLIAYDVCGVQPMNLPTGLIFAMKAKYTSQGGTEALFNEANSAFSGNDTPAHSGDNPTGATYTTGVGMSTARAEGLGSSGGGTFNEMAFSIEKVSVTAKSRALKAEYTQELAQDLKAVHGLDAEQELSNILSG